MVADAWSRSSGLGVLSVTGWPPVYCKERRKKTMKKGEDIMDYGNTLEHNGVAEALDQHLLEHACHDASSCSTVQTLD